MNGRWLSGVVVLMLCAGSYALGRTQAQATMAVTEPQAIACNEAPRQLSAESVRLQTPGATREQKVVLPPVENVAIQSASHTVENAINRGVWSNEDVQMFRAAAPDMTADERERLIRRLTVAFNNGEVRVAVDRGPPF
jgi:hypothetical protein